MASTKGFLEYVLEQLSPLSEVSFRAMMGEYVVYCMGKVIGGVCDDRFLLKPTDGALALLKEAGREARMDIPYPGAKPMLTADIDNRELTCALVRAVLNDLPDAKAKKPLKKLS